MGFKDFFKRLLKREASPEENLSSKTVKGTFWVSSLRIASRLVMLVRLIILARILSPEDFGVFGISLLVLSIINSIYFVKLVNIFYNNCLCLGTSIK